MPKCADVRAVGEFVASRHGVFTRKQASQLGLSKEDIARLVRDGAVASLTRSVLCFTSYPTTWRQAAYAATVDGSAVASHATAGALHRLDGCELRPDGPFVSVEYSRRSNRLGVVAHRSCDLSEDDITEVDGIRCTTIARTICDLAGDATVSTDDLIRMIDDVQRRGTSMLWLLQVANRLRRPGRAGPTRVIAIVERRQNGYRVPDSFFERLLARCLKSPWLVGIERQYELRDADGLVIARFDLAVPWVRLGIEGHSRSFHLGEHPERYDEDRDLATAAEGWDIAYLGFAASKAPAAVCATIERIVRRRMADLGIAAPP